MATKTYSTDQAAALLNMGRNTLLRQLRELGLLGSDNLPTGRERGGPHFRVRTRAYQHPVLGYTHYGRTEITARGLEYIARRLGAEPKTPPTDNCRPIQKNAAPRGTTRTERMPMEKSNLTTPILPEGTLHDAGELSVVGPDGERVYHRNALVVVFDTPFELQRAINAHRCTYLARRDIPEVQLHPEQVARQQG